MKFVSHFRKTTFAFAVAFLISLLALSLFGEKSVYGQNSAAPTPSPKVSPTPSPTPRPQQPSELQKALGEFRTQMNMLGGGTGSAKSTGKQNKLSGRIYENLRNDLFDAVPHEVRQRGGTKSLLRRNQYGFSVSGPVWVPKLFDGRGKTFFSVNFEATRERIAQSALFTVATDKQRLGDFSDLVDSAGQRIPIYDPLTTRPNPAYDPSQAVSATNPQYLRDPFPNNIIPANRLEPIAKSAVALYPRSNINVGPFLQNNYWVNSPFENRADGAIAKVDHQLTEKQQLGINFNLSRGLRKSPEYYPGPANAGAPSYNYENGSLSVQDVFTASPQTVWTFRAATAYGATTSVEQDAGQNYPQQLGLKGLFAGYFPRLTFSNGYLSIGPGTPVFRDRSYSHSGSLALSINRKAHTFQLSGLGRRSFVNSLSPSFPSGWFSFTGSATALPGVNNTGSAFASFLLGMVSRAEEGVVLHPSYYSKNFFDSTFSDQWRVRPGVSLFGSLSFEVATPRIEKYDRQSTVSLDHTNLANGKPGALIFAARNGIGRGLQPVTARIEPSVSVSVNPLNDRKTVMRASYSLSYEDYPLYGRHFGTQGFNATPVFVSANDQLRPAFLLRDGMPTNFAQPPFLDPTAVNGIEPDYIDRTGLLPTNQQWTFSIQRELPRALTLNVLYTGWRGAHELVDGFARLNMVPVSNLKYRDQLYDEAFRNSLRPFPQYRSFDMGGLYPVGALKGNSMSATIDQRLTGGLFGRFSYRLAKVLDNYSSGTPQDPDNRRLEWSLSTSDVTHSISASYTYELPFGRGKKFFADNLFVSRTLGGWNLSGLTSWRGGQPLILRPWFNRTGGVVGNLRVNVVPGVDPDVETQSPQQWFNVAAFAQPDDFTLGDGPRTHPQLRDPGAHVHHLSLTKRIELNADTSLEFVSEAFNFLNHANLNDPDTRIGPESSPNLNAGKIIGSTGGRVMQFGLRILF
ncbi:MAG TPA: hypothetical protein PLK30_21980 [Blastocatellia bacterium]|nr:hypothetical protein [Blastocatellia bacterium]